MSNRMLEIGQQILWLLGHCLFTLIVVCAVRGGYHFYKDYEAMQPIQIDVSQLTEEEKIALSNALLDSGTSVPRPEGRNKQRG